MAKTKPMMNLREGAHGVERAKCELSCAADPTKPQAHHAAVKPGARVTIPVGAVLRLASIVTAAVELVNDPCRGACRTWFGTPDVKF